MRTLRASLRTTRDGLTGRRRKGGERDRRMPESCKIRTTIIQRGEEGKERKKGVCRKLRISQNVTYLHDTISSVLRKGGRALPSPHCVLAVSWTLTASWPV